MVSRKETRFNAEGQTRLQQMRAAEYPGGVVVDPVPISAGSEITVLYHGLLHTSGADQVWMRTGYGDARNWEKVYDHPMDYTGYGWTKTLKVEDNSRLNICFKDSADNWDNNNAINWSFEIHGGRLSDR